MLGQFAGEFAKISLKQITYLKINKNKKIDSSVSILVNKAIKLARISIACFYN